MSIRSFISALSLLAFLAVASGCSTTRDLPYFDNTSDVGQGILGDIQDYQLKIEPDDELLITVNSVNPKATADYNLPLINPATSEQAAMAQTATQQQTYIVNALGDINFPILGKIHVKGMTTMELTAYLTERISEKVVDPVVRVSLVNFAVTVIGEVDTPQRIPVKNGRITVLDALGQAGDMTEYGRRDNVLVIRETDGKKVYQRLNLRDASITESPFYYLRQNDVVYVVPNDIIQANSKYNTNNAYKLSVVSAIVSGLSVVTSLIIALSR
ncbi:MAG: polysaccharide biosynthesis/export family protein [Pseudoflavonifractor sp.]|nr:polysaccharide biosynthesis/export family protein [Alloprevotella sp.]MCM1116124.1 polysaccharide biosynthesis/export family protein [Pseudoflavonifractor sp.]